MFPREAVSAPASAKAMPSVGFPLPVPRPISGRNTSTIPPIPSTAPSRVEGFRGVPKKKRVPTMFRTTRSEKSTATSPEVISVSAR